MIKQSWFHFCWCVRKTKSCKKTVHPLCSLALSVTCWVLVRASFLQNPKPENLGKLLWNAPSLYQTKAVTSFALKTQCHKLAGENLWSGRHLQGVLTTSFSTHMRCERIHIILGSSTNWCENPSFVVFRTTCIMPNDITSSVHFIDYDIMTRRT